MRWFQIDQFEEFVCGQHAVARKVVSLSEPHVCDYIPGYPTIPPSLMVEGIAQTGGLLVGQKFDWEAKVVLAKVTKVSFDSIPRPGDILRYKATIERMTDDGGIVAGTVTMNGEPMGKAEIVFAYLNATAGFEDTKLFPPSDLLQMLRSTRLFEVAVKQDGTPLEVPATLLKPDDAA